MHSRTSRYHSVSYFRRLIVDLMHFSAKVPSATIDRRLNLARLVDVRQACRPAPTWSAIFTKAYGVVAAGNAKLRTSYMSCPWPRFYENASNIATINVDRELEHERVILYAHVQNPEHLTLREIDAIVSYYKTEPVDNIPTYRHARRMSMVPWPLRRMLWWAALNMFGSQRCRHFGTFGMSSVGCHGSGILKLTPLLTSTIHYGMFDSAGRVEMRLSFDHRVLDASLAANALAELEEVLNGQILDECLTMLAPAERPSLNGLNVVWADGANPSEERRVS